MGGDSLRWYKGKKGKGVWFSEIDSRSFQYTSIDGYLQQLCVAVRRSQVPGGIGRGSQSGVAKHGDENKLWDDLQ